jgi:hypothetical protein
MSAASTAIEAVEPSTYGSAMQKLSARRQRFVLALVNDVPPGPGAEIAAAKLAGFKADNDGALRAQATKLVHDQNVVAAIIETAREGIHHLAPMAVQGLREIAKDKFNRDRFKAIEAILKRFMPERIEAKIEVETIDRTKVTLDHLAHMLEIGVAHEALVKEFGEFGLTHYMQLLEAQKPEKPQVIEGDFKVIEPDPVPAVAAKPDDQQAETLEDLI